MAINFAGAAGSEAIERNRQKTGGGFYTPSIYWKNVGDETRPCLAAHPENSP